MHPAALIPAASPIPVPWGWFELLLILTFVLHILFMNCLLGSVLFCAAKSLSGNSTAPALKDHSLRMPTILALTVNLGVAPLLFAQVLYGQFIYSSSILIAWWWLGVIFILIAAYYGLYVYDFRFEELGAKRIFFIVGPAVLLLLIAYIYVNNMTLAYTPDRWFEYFKTPDGTLLNLGDPQILPRYLHFVLSAVAIGGLWQAIIWHRKRCKCQKAEHTVADENVATGLRWFSRATGLQFVVGSWFLLSLPKYLYKNYMGKEQLETGLFGIGILLTLAALHFARKGKVWATAGTTVAIVTVMALMRDLLRQAYVKPYFHPSELAVTSEYSPMVLFLASFILGLGLVAYMLKLYAKAMKEGK